MEIDIEKLLKEKSFSDLTSFEKEEFKDLFQNEEEYENMRSMFAGIDAMNVELEEPSLKTKSKLDDLFQETYHKAPVLWYNNAWTFLYPEDKSFVRKPLVQIAAIFVLILMIVPFVNQQKINTHQNEIAKEELQNEIKSNETNAPLTSMKSDPQQLAKNESNVAPQENEHVAQDEFENVLHEQVFSSTDNVTMSPPPVASSNGATSESFYEANSSETKNLEKKDLSRSVSEQISVLDLLTPAF